MHTYIKVMVGLCNEIFQDHNRTAYVVLYTSGLHKLFVVHVRVLCVKKY